MINTSTMEKPASPNLILVDPQFLASGNFGFYWKEPTVDKEEDLTKCPLSFYKSFGHSVWP